MEREVYSTYEAKAKFSQLLRKVQQNKRIIITHRGRPVAELGPVAADALPLEDHLAQLEDQGLIEPARTDPRAALQTIAARPGVLDRFLRDRD